MMDYLEVDLLTYLHQFVLITLIGLGRPVHSRWYHSLLRVEKELSMAFVNCSLLIVDKRPVL